MEIFALIGILLFIPKVCFIKFENESVFSFTGLFYLLEYRSETINNKKNSYLMLRVRKNPFCSKSIYVNDKLQKICWHTLFNSEKPQKANAKNILLISEKSEVE